MSADTVCGVRAPSTHPFGPCVRPPFHRGEHESSRLAGVPMIWPRWPIGAVWRVRYAFAKQLRRAAQRVWPHRCERRDAHCRACPAHYVVP